jgi:hypothetical protein
MPTTFPTNARINNTRQITFVPMKYGTSFTSPFTGQKQEVRYSGQCWQLDIEFNPLLQTDSEELMAFLVALNGTDTGTFYYTLPAKFRMSGTIAITVTADGNTFTTAGTPQVGKFAVAGTRLVQITSATTIFPRLPAGNYTLSNSSGALYRLTKPEQSFAIDYMMMGAFNMSITEAY